MIRGEKAIEYLKAQGNKKIGIAGASTTGMLSLVAASYLSRRFQLVGVYAPTNFYI